MNDDLISRSALKEFINEVCFSEEWVKFRVDNGSRGQIERILKYIDNAPTVEVYTFEQVQELVRDLTVDFPQIVDRAIQLYIEEKRGENHEE